MSNAQLNLPVGHLKIPHLVVVHVIEGRGLSGLDRSGTSDAVCIVELGPTSRRRQITLNQPETNNALWEKTFIFDHIWLTENQFNAEKIALKVFDRNTVFRDALIGSAEISFSFVYRKKTKCLSRQWLGLYLPNDPATIHGYILVSVYILRPGDPPPTLVPSPSSISLIDTNPILKLPQIRYKPFHLNVLIYRAEQILVDRHVHLNPFVSVRFNGNSVRTSSRSNQHNPIFNRRFEMPFYIPVTSDSIEIMLWNETSGRPDVLIASITFSQNELTYKPWGPKWVSFYTSPTTSGFLASLMESFKPDIDVPCEFAGRLLVRFSVSPVKRTKLLSMPLETITDEPSGLPYLVKFQLYSAADLSVNAGKLAVEIDFAGNRLTSAFVNVNHGACAWNCNFKSIKAVMPFDLEQVPDVIITIIHRVGMIESKIAYIRLPVKILLGMNMDCAVNADQNPSGESWAPIWRFLQPIRSNDDRIVPGLLLFTIGVGRATASFEKAADQAKLIQPSMKKYRLSSNIHMAVNLPHLSDIGLANCFAVVRVAGVSGTTSIKYDTLYPIWNEDINFEFSLDPGLMPRVSILIYHSSGMVSKSLICRTDIAVPITKSGSVSAHNAFSRYPLYSSDTPNLADRDSFLIARFQVLEGNYTTPVQKLQQFDQANSRSSVLLLQASLIFHGVGVRDVHLTKNVSALSQPQLEISVPDCSPGAQPGHMITKTVNPTGPVVNGAADFKELIRFDDICLPQTDIDAFAVLIRLYDRRATGRARIGFRYVKLEDIWCGRGNKGNLERRQLGGVKGSQDSPWYETLTQSKQEGLVLPSASGTKSLVDATWQGKLDSMALDIDSLNITVTTTNPIRKENIDVSTFNDKTDNAYVNRTMTSFEQDFNDLLQKDSKAANSVMKLEFIRDVHALSKEVQTSLLDISKGLRSSIGHLKAILIAGDRNDMELYDENSAVFQSLSETYAVRLYVYRGISFNPQQSWIGERGRMQSYLVIKNGAESYQQINDRASSDAIFDMDELNPEFARAFQLQCKFPENAILDISVWNRSLLRADRLIGSTSIDLEQRILNPTWHSLPAAQRQEQRSLLSEEGQLSRGKLELRVDLVGWQESLEIPLEILSRSEPEPYELRLVIWTTRDIRWPTDNRDDEIDQFITCTANFDGIPGNDIVRSTDTAWGSGPNADWNYRMVFPITLPCKVSRLKLTVWDADIFGRTAIGDVIINLAPKLTEALRERRRVLHIPGQWLHIEHPDAQGKQLGDVHVEMWALAKNEAEAAPVGEGQNHPNRDPFLAPPSRKPPPWAVGSRLLNTLELFSKRKNVLMAICCLLIAVPLVVPLIFGKLSSIL